MNARILLACSAWILLAAPSAARAGTTWYVDDDACPGLGAGTRSAPFCSIQAGVDAASDGDLVLVAPGFYIERVDFLGKAIRVVASEGPSATTIGNPPLSHAPVGAIFQNGEGPDSVLDGFTISGYDGFDGAVQCTFSAPTIIRNVITGNTTSAIRCASALDVRITSNVIRGNSMLAPGYTGAGIYAFGSTLRISGNVIDRNYLDSFRGFGAGVYLESCSAIFTSNVVTGNWCDYDGGGGSNAGAGLFALRSLVVVRGATFSRNVAGAALFVNGRGGAIACDQSELYLSNTILWDDSAYSGFPTEEGPELYATNSFVHIDHSDVDGGLADIFALGGTLRWGDGNVDVEPAFVDPASYDFRLTASSPLIDRGTPIQAPGGTDAFGDPRILDGDENLVERVDVGADEFNVTVLSADSTAKLGSTITFATDAPAGRTYAFALSTGPGDTPVAPFGSALISVPLVLLVRTGVVPGSDDVRVPALAGLAGLEIWGQSLSTDTATGAGTLSNVVRLVVH